jgi:phage terminase small subunit
MRGRKPKPTHLKALQGLPCHHPMRADEPQPAISTRPARPPRDLRGEARKEWKRVAGALHGAGLLTPLDERALLGYCVHYARWVEARAETAKIGTVIRAAYHLMRAPLET